jgi:tetratricopeptide (TPR) repeat protein
MLLRWFRSLFGRKPEKGTIVPEKWESSFSSRRKERFEEESDDRFRARLHKGYLSLELARPNLFAWSLNSAYRYRNFVMDLSFSFDEDNGHSAAGALFRYLSEKNYYYALISDDGHFRFDVVFNGNPIALIPWIPAGPPREGQKSPQDEELSVQQSADRTLRIIAHETSFAFFLDGEWIAELDDEMIDAGYVAFAGQNYGEGDTARFRFDHYVIESRPMEVEVLFQRWVNYLEPASERRIALARRLFEMAQAGPALVQLKKAFRSSRPATKQRFFLVEVLITLELYDAALEQLEVCLDEDPDFREAVIEKANLLYLLNRFLEAKGWIDAWEEEFPDHGALMNLRGNTEYALGNWAEAVEHYRRALELEPQMPLYALNLARAREKTGDTDKAKEYYLTAARGFFREEAFGELAPIRARLEELAPGDATMRAIEGKIRFQEGNFFEAERIFRSLIEEASAESEIFFLEGLVCMQRGALREAAEQLRRAVEMEPGFHLYRFRLAESLHLAGLPAREELQKALELFPEDGWTRNLAGLIEMEEDRYLEALRHLEAAYAALPQEAEVQINYSWALFKTALEEERMRDALKKAKAVLKNEGDPRVLNHLGNLHAEAGDPEGAVPFYRRAIEASPDKSDYIENIAAVLMRLDRVPEAEEYLIRILEEQETASLGIYDKVADIASRKGEYERACAALEKALEIDPQELRIRMKLLRLLTSRGRWNRAKEQLKMAEQQLSGDRRRGEAGSENDLAKELEKIRREIREASETRYTCSSCGREWWVPVNAEIPPRLRLYGEPPKESPAGKCPSCGKVYCIACAMNHMKGSRFVCPECGEYLKLSEGGLKYLALSYAQKADDDSPHSE